MAGIDERVKIRADFSKFKFLSGSLQMEAVAHYQYYIPFRGLKFDTSKSDDGMLRFAFYFDTLECETPVKYSEIKCDVRESSISDGVNAKIAEYKKSEFPQYLAERSKSAQNMLRARIDAEVSLKKYVLENVLAPAASPRTKSAQSTLFSTRKNSKLSSRASATAGNAKRTRTRSRLRACGKQIPRFQNQPHAPADAKPLRGANRARKKNAGIRNLRKI